MNDSSQSPRAVRDWQPLATIELPAAADGEQLAAWLRDVLLPLALTDDFTGKLLASLRDSTNCIPEEVEHIHLLVYLSAVRPEQGQVWGFFRMERRQASPTSLGSSIHAIVFYLYVEDSPDPG